MPVIDWKTGVYMIFNVVNGKVYVGSAAVSLLGRMSNHRSCLRGGYHSNGHLQAAWNKYGEESFQFTVVERCRPRDCVANEQEWIDHFDSANRDNGYNIAPKAGNTLGVPNPNKGKPGQKHSEESRELMKTTNKGKAEALRGVPKSDDHKKKLSEITTKQFADPVVRAEMARIKNERYARDPDLKKRISITLTGRKQSLETIAKRVAKLTGQKRSPESIANLTEGARKRVEKRRNQAMAEILGTG